VNAPSEWFVSANSQLYGPYSEEQLIAFAKEGRVTAGTMVRNGRSGPFDEASKVPVLAAIFGATVSPPKATAADEARPVNFVIIADLRQRGAVPFEAAINKLGPNYRLSPNVWMLQSALTAGAIRNELTPTVGGHDNCVVVDATRNKIAWFNLGPQADASLRAIWLKGGGEPKA
jgi:hypothetical protein